VAGLDLWRPPSRGFRLRDWAGMLLAVLAFKHLYGTASTAQIQWLLLPLATLLNGVGALSFTPTPTGEWLDAEHGLVMVKACAGGNFLIASWLAYLWRRRESGFTAEMAGRAFAAAWLTTLAANTLRILVIAHCQDALARLSGLSAADSHRLIGILTYFGVLWAQLACGGTRRTALPIAAAVYLGITLLLPAVRGIVSGSHGPDITHLSWTAGVPLAALAVRQTLGRAWRMRRTRLETEGRGWVSASGNQTVSGSAASSVWRLP
jgi:exosortase K